MNVILLKKEESLVNESSTVYLEQIKKACLSLACIEGKGIRLEINAINTDRQKNCRVLYTVELD